jgi:nucleoside-diphosphate-sugar epimerase
MKVLVTGNKGYIGSLLCENLLEEDFDVIGLDTCYYKGCNFTDFNSKILQIEKDIRNITKEDLDGIEAIIHLAALSNDPMGDLNPKLTSDINYKASVRLAKIAKEKRVKRFIFSSSCSV